MKQKYVEECEKDIKELTDNWHSLNKEFGLSITNKIHVIEHPFLDYVIISGKTLGETNDKIIETTHHYFMQ